MCKNIELWTEGMFLGFLVSKTMEKSGGGSFYQECRHPIWSPLLLLIPPILPLFWTYRVEYNGDELLFGYNTSYCSKKIKKEHIGGIESCNINGLSDWGGWGIRMSLTQAGWGYIAENGPGIKVFDRENNKYYTFSCQNPQQLIEALNSQTE